MFFFTKYFTHVKFLPRKSISQISTNATWKKKIKITSISQAHKKMCLINCVPVFIENSRRYQRFQETIPFKNVLLHNFHTTTDERILSPAAVDRIQMRDKIIHLSHRYSHGCRNRQSPRTILPNQDNHY